jgi:hypothetical protein
MARREKPPTPATGVLIALAGNNQKRQSPEPENGLRLEPAH